MFKADVARLEAKGYETIELDCAKWTSVARFHQGLNRILRFPDYYGMNLDALDECLRDDVEVPYEGGLALVLLRFDSFARGFTRHAQTLLDIITSASHEKFLTGHRLLALLQSDDPDIVFEPIDPKRVHWNDREAADSDRKRKNGGEN